MRYRIEVEQDTEGMFVAECPALAGCISRGFTRFEAIENIRETIARHVDDERAHTDDTDDN